MQYPHIQFYRGSLVRLASGKLKQVEDLSSDDFIESARLASGNSSSSSSSSSFDFNTTLNQQFNTFTASLTDCNTTTSSKCNQHAPMRSQSQSSNYRPSQQQDEQHNNNNNNINNSVFNSPEPHATTSRSSYNESPLMETEDICDDDDDEEEEIELDVVTHDEEADEELRRRLNIEQTMAASSMEAESDKPSREVEQQQVEDDDFYIDSSVVRDFLEVGPIVEQQQRKLANSNGHLNQCGSPASSTGSLSQLAPVKREDNNHHSLLSSIRPSTSKSSSSSSLAISPPIVTSSAIVQQPETVLIKFFLETSRNIAFIEVPIEHPFFVFHRGWSSWNPQKTYDKFGLKCRKLKIGDTCISLIRKRRRKANDTVGVDSSDQCNVLFSSIRIHE